MRGGFCFYAVCRAYGAFIYLHTLSGKHFPHVYSHAGSMGINIYSYAGTVGINQCK